MDVIRELETLEASLLQQQQQQQHQQQKHQIVTSSSRESMSPVNRAINNHSIAVDTHLDEAKSVKKILIKPMTNSTSIIISSSSSSTSSSSTSSSSSSKSGVSTSSPPATTTTQSNTQPLTTTIMVTNESDKPTEKPTVGGSRGGVAATPSSSSSTSSVVAALSVLSFSTSSPSSTSDSATSSSTSSLSSSLSYSNAVATATAGKSSESTDRNHRLSTAATTNIESILSSLGSPKNSHEKTADKSSAALITERNSSRIYVNSNVLAEILSPFRGKPYYGKEWLFRTLNQYTTSKQLTLNESSTEISAAKCLVLVGDTGTGKSHLCCELKWPTRKSNETTIQSDRFIGAHFFSLFNRRQNSLRNFYTHLSSILIEFYLQNEPIFSATDSNGGSLFKSSSSRLQLKDFLQIVEEDNEDNQEEEEEEEKNNEDAMNAGELLTTAKDRVNNEEEEEEEENDELVEKYANKFISNVLKPLNSVQLTSKSYNYFILVDGIDDLLLLAERVLFTSVASCAVLQFVSRVFLYFPHWLNLVVTCRRATEKAHLRRHLANVKYDRLVMDKCVNLTSCGAASSVGVKLQTKDENDSKQSTTTTSSVTSSSHLSNSNITSSSSSSSNMLSSFSSHSLLQSAASSTSATSSAGLSSSSSNQPNLDHAIQQRNASASAASKRLSTPSLDVFNAAHIANLKDIQTYILRRLDADQPLKARFSRLNKHASIELLNLLLIKSNYSILYVEKCFDLIVTPTTTTVTSNNDGCFLAPDEIKSIPVHLNGLYLYILERILADLQLKLDANVFNLKELVYTIFSVGLLEMRPFRPNSLFDKTKFRYPSLSRSEFDMVFNYIAPILFTRTKHVQTQSSIEPASTSNDAVIHHHTQNQTYTLFHSSFVDWFTDVKFSTRKYYHPLNQTHLLLAYYAYDRLCSHNRVAIMESGDDNDDDNRGSAMKSFAKRTKILWSRFRFHFAKSNSSPTPAANSVSSMSSTGLQQQQQQPAVLDEAVLNYLYLLFDFDYEYKVCLNSLERKLLQCKRMLKLDEKREDAFHYHRTDGGASLFPTSCVEKLRNNLFEVISRGDLSALKQFLSVGVDASRVSELMRRQRPLLVDESNQTLLLAAVKANLVELVDYVLKLNTAAIEHCDSNGWSPLRYASWIGNESVVRLLLENGAQVDACDSENRTALSAAVFSGHDHIVRLLIKNGADVTKCDREQRSVLHVAVEMGHLTLVNYLLLNGANINQCDRLLRTPIATSILAFTSSQSPAQTQQNRCEIVKLLIKYGSSLDLADANHQTPLILAACSSPPLPMSCINLLISGGCDLDHIDANGNTALTYAICNRLESLVDVLLKHNAATHILDREGRSVLSIACSLGADAIVGKLMQRGLDEMHRDNSGCTPLHEAVSGGHIRVAEMLIDYGGSNGGGGSELADAGDNEGRTPLHVACQRGHVDLVRILVLKGGANVEAKSHEGSSPLRIACLHGNIEIARFLVDRANAAVDSRDTDGRTTLMVVLNLAVAANAALESSADKNQKLIKSSETVKFLADRGADPNARDYSHPDGLNRTCLHTAAMHGLVAHLTHLLSSSKADAESTDSRQRTPLMTAVVNGHIECVRALLTASLKSIDRRDTEGHTALSLAAFAGRVDIADELLKSGAQIYASARNPIKLAHHSGNNELVSLLQYWSTLCYQQGYQQYQQQQQMQQSTPRNSKSTESFRSSSARISGNYQSIQQQQQQRANDREPINMPNFNNRCAITPTTFSSYMKNLGHISSSVSASPLVIIPNSGGCEMPSVSAAPTPTSKFEMFSARNFRPLSDSRNPPTHNRSLIVNLNQCDQQQHSEGEQQEGKQQPKISKLKYVRDKLLLRKSSIIHHTTQQQGSAAAEPKQRRSNSTYLAASSSSSSSNSTTNNLVNATSEFSLVTGLDRMKSSCSPLSHIQQQQQPRTSSIHSSASFRHYSSSSGLVADSSNYARVNCGGAVTGGLTPVNASGAGKKPRIMSVIAQQQTLNEDEEVSDFSFCNKENFYNLNNNKATPTADQQGNITSSDSSSSSKKIPSVNAKSMNNTINNNSSEEKKSSSFVQMIKKKFRFLTNSTNHQNSNNQISNSKIHLNRDETSSNNHKNSGDDSEKTNSIDFHRSKQSINNNPAFVMHRSITDTLNSSSYTNVPANYNHHYPSHQYQYLNHHHHHNHTMNTSIGDMSVSSTIRDLDSSSSMMLPTSNNAAAAAAPYVGRRRSSITTANDDVAHIFNRNSLNDCLNPPTSRRRADYVSIGGGGAGGSYRLFSTPVSSNLPKRPSCLILNNHFKKETSI